MESNLVQSWNSDPPPTDRFLKELKRWKEASEANGKEAINCSPMIEAISTPQDLAQFLLERSADIEYDPDLENPTVGRYWDALAGVISIFAQSSKPDWKEIAQALDNALYYE